jgi:hypothetical protein
MPTTFAILLALALAAPALPQTTRRQPKAPLVTVYRTATCGCCSKWIQHLKSAGFEVDDHVIDKVDDAPLRARVPEPLRSCHTATVAGFAIEGHVPADVIKDLLKRKPAIAGIAVPGMPAGSPGMESPNPQPYEVVAFDAHGRTSTFATR